MGGNEVFQHGKSFTEVGDNRTFDNIAGGFRHQSAHTGELTDLIFTSAGAGVKHGVDRVDLSALAGGFKMFKKFIRHSTAGLSPDIDDLLVTFTVGQQTAVVLFKNGVHLFAGGFNQFTLTVRNLKVGDGDGKTGKSCVSVTQILDIIQQLDGRIVSGDHVGVTDEFSQIFLLGNGIVESETLIPDFVEKTTSGSGQDVLGILITVNRFASQVGVRNTDGIVDTDIA